MTVNLADGRGGRPCPPDPQPGRQEEPREDQSLHSGRLAEAGSRDQREGPCVGHGCFCLALTFCRFKCLWLVGESVDLTAFA